MKIRVEERFLAPYAPDLTVLELFDGLSEELAGFLGRFRLSVSVLEELMFDTFVCLHHLGGYRSGPMAPKVWVFRHAVEHLRRYASWNGAARELPS